MSKARKRNGKRPPQTKVDRAASTDVVTQLEVALRNPHAAAIGAVLGGLVPWFGRTLAHGQIQDAWTAGNRAFALAMGAVVLGCGAFSGLSVYKFGRAAFGDPRKAFGFMLALEGVMLVSCGVTSIVALGTLILINAIANGSVIALARDATRRKREADARGAATRARSRASVGTPVPYGFPNSPTTPVQAPAPSTTGCPSPARPAPLWQRILFHPVIDAKVVSETKFLA